ncbi:MAG: lipid-A-disaccharide synthase [Alphaproteobacteria bacterium GM202ARS2]|nr:lipid-A-disaccharide synthase [Alphaproteobacteria bacterium GM202ARS2]
MSKKSLETIAKKTPSGAGHVYRVFIVAGENSGDVLAAGVMESLRRAMPQARFEFEGIGGAGMRAAGLRVFADMRVLSVMGFFQVVPRLWAILRCLRQTVARIAEARPHVVMTVDAPSFAMRLAARLRRKKETRDMCLVHYVAPTVWAWKSFRAKKMARLYDHLLALLPFEPPYFERHGLPTYFVGHPSAWQEKEDKKDSNKDRADFCRRHGWLEEDTLLCVCSGSRDSEIKRHRRVIEASVRGVRARLGDNHRLRVVAVAAQGCERAVDRALGGSVDVVVTEDDKVRAFCAADGALAVSGTVSVDLARRGVAMVVIYAMDGVSAFLLRRLVRVQYASLLNILADKVVIPEFLMEKCRSELIIEGLYPLLDNETLRAEQTRTMTAWLGKMLVDDRVSPSVHAACVLRDKVFMRLTD